MPPRSHIAGPVELDELEGTVQRCLRCDETLIHPGRPLGDSGVEYEVKVGRKVLGDCLGGVEQREQQLVHAAAYETEE